MASAQPTHLGESSATSDLRLLAGAAVGFVLIGLAVLTVFGALFGDFARFEDPSAPAAPSWEASLSVAVVFFLASGPAAWLVSGRRWMRWLPLGLGVPAAALIALSVTIANAT